MKSICIEDLRRPPRTKEQKIKFAEDTRKQLEESIARDKQEAQRSFELMQKYQADQQRIYKEQQVEIQLEALRQHECEKGERRNLSEKIKEPKVTSKFSSFENLRSNEIAFVMMSNGKAKMVIRKKSITIFSIDLGLKYPSREWRLLDSACVNEGSLNNFLNQENKTSNREGELKKIKSMISRFRKKLRGSMGLESKDDPIPYRKGSGYCFNFKIMQHAEFHGEFITKGNDAMDFTPGSDFNEEQEDGNNTY